MFSTIQNFNFNIEGPREKRTGQQVYFEGSKKNQLNDIKNYLKMIVSDPEKENYRKELIKKIVSYTTIGIDTSRLYPQIVIASATKDLVQKKLIYHYLGIYSSANANFARMAINTFVKDCSSSNPSIRSLAARNLANLRFKGRDQYAYPLLLQGLSDFSPLMKKSCVMGLTKLIVQKNRGLQNPQRDENILNKFYEMIRENDPSLICTVIQAINQIEQEGIAMSKKLAFYLLQNSKIFGDMLFPIILQYIELYDPKNDEQITHILTTLQARLKSSSPAVVLAISKIYLKMAKLKPVISSKIISVLRKSLFSFINHSEPELEYVVLKHIEYLIATYGPEQFKDYYKRFLLYPGEKTYIKKVKISILEKLINKSNEVDIINEIAEYLSEEDISSDAVDSFARIMLRSKQGQAKFIIKTIIKTVQTCPRSYICNNVLPLIRNYLRIYPKQFSMFSQIFYSLIDNAKQEFSRCCALELVGDFGQHIQDAVELIAWDKNEASDNVKISILRANVKLFLKRPAEVYNALTSIFRDILLDDQIHLHLKDYAAFLYRGLAAGVEQFKAIFLDTRKEQQKNSLQELVKDLEFNTLQVIYAQKQEKWMLDKLKYIEVQEPLPIDAQVVGQAEEEVTSSSVEINMDSRFKKLQAGNFDVTFTMSTDEFEYHWENKDVGSSITRVAKNVQLLTQENLQQLFRIWNITVLACADSEQQIKFYNYCQIQQSEGNLGIACMQFCVHKLPQTMTLMIKCDDDELAGFISRYIEDFLRINEFI